MSNMSKNIMLPRTREELFRDIQKMILINKQIWDLEKELCDPDYSYSSIIKFEEELEQARDNLEKFIVEGLI